MNAPIITRAADQAGKRVIINLRGGNVMDRMKTASGLLGYQHAHRDLITKSVDDNIQTKDVVWGRKAIVLPLSHPSTHCGNTAHVEVGITIFDTRQSRGRNSSEQLVFVYGDRIMHKNCDTICPKHALHEILLSYGYIFIDWSPVTPLISE